MAAALLDVGLEHLDHEVEEGGEVVEADADLVGPEHDAELAARAAAVEGEDRLGPAVDAERHQRRPPVRPARGGRVAEIDHHPRDVDERAAHDLRRREQARAQVELREAVVEREELAVGRRQLAPDLALHGDEGRGRRAGGREHRHPGARIEAREVELERADFGEEEGDRHAREPRREASINAK